MSNHPQLGLDHLLLDVATQMAPPSMLLGPLAVVLANSDWIPPPASLTAVNSEGIDLNDEIFFSYNPLGSSAPYADVYAPSNDMEVLLLTLLLATLPYNALQLAITTPDLSLASPVKLDANLHYSHHRRFSLTVDQLNRMTIHPHRLKLPSPEGYVGLGLPQKNIEERTINPRQLLGINLGVSMGAASAGQNIAPVSSRYILPSSVLSPSLSTFFSRGGGMADVDFPTHDVVANGMQGLIEMQEMPIPAANDGVIGVNNYVMNEECVSAITSWLNNTDNIILDKADGAAMRNPTGIVKPNWKRRNSIQVLPTRTELVMQRGPPGQKRKHRKSVNSSIPEDTVPAQVSQSLHLPPTSYAPQFLPMSLYSMEPALQPEPALVRGLDTGSDGLQTSSFSLKSVESVGVPLVDKPVSRQLSVTENDDEPKPFPCPECEKQFKRLEHLKRHIRSVHLNIRPFHCKYCEKKFLRSDNLAQHSKTHFKLNANGTTTIIYGNPNPHSRGGRKKSVSSDGVSGAQDS